MAAGLRVVVLPPGVAGPRLLAFTERLVEALIAAGAHVERLDHAPPGQLKVPNGSVVLAIGDLPDGRLPVDFVDSLRRVTLVGIYEGPCAALRARGEQQRLDRLVDVLAWNIVQLALFVDDDGWTLGTMNGALCRFSRRDLLRDVREVLVPKLAAPVVPPHRRDFDEAPAVDPRRPDVAVAVEAFARGAARWAETGLMLYHTPLESLRFRDRRYARIARAYLDGRSGMSYGFLAYQLPTGRPNGDVVGSRLRVQRGGESLDVAVPPIRFLCTRSGCDKSRLDLSRDLVLLELRDGRLRFGAVGDVEPGRPSYDSLTIVAHGLANVVVAEWLRRRDPAAAFATALSRSGMALAHWHGAIDPADVPPSYPVHGTERPPVSCSTLQSALFAILGKLMALPSSPRRVEPGRRIGLAASDYVGDVHVEPLHGVNACGPDLRQLADLAERLNAAACAQSIATGGNS